MYYYPSTYMMYLYRYVIVLITIFVIGCFYIPNNTILLTIRVFISYLEKYNRIYDYVSEHSGAYIGETRLAGSKIVNSTYIFRTIEKSK